jgi:hypothetical protein
VDAKVLEAQRWVNATYGTVPGYVRAPEDGKTGWSTMYALTRALQHELGITALSNSFGPATRFASQHESNHRSGTAVDIRPGWYPAGLAGGFFPHQLVVIRDILAECEGVVRWGGDYRRSVDENHFQIDVRPGDARLRRVAAKLERRAAAHGQGAGSGDYLPFTPARMSRAHALRRRQGVLA